MPPAKETVLGYLTLYRGLPFEQTLLYTTAAGGKIDLSDANIKAVVMADVDDPDGEELFTWTTDDGSIVGGNGSMTFKITDPATIEAFDWGEGVMHVVVQQPGQVPKVVTFLGVLVQNSTTDMV